LIVLSKDGPTVSFQLVYGSHDSSSPLSAANVDAAQKELDARNFQPEKRA
jgi:hypothetical protein